MCLRFWWKQCSCTRMFIAMMWESDWWHDPRTFVCRSGATRKLQNPNHSADTRAAATSKGSRQLPPSHNISQGTHRCRPVPQQPQQDAGSHWQQQLPQPLLIHTGTCRASEQLRRDGSVNCYSISISVIIIHLFCCLPAASQAWSPERSFCWGDFFLQDYLPFLGWLQVEMKFCWNGFIKRRLVRLAEP